MRSDSAYAAHAMAPARAIWHQPSAAFDPDRARIDPPPLPKPSPNKKTARMIENVYTVAPIMTERSRVQITSAPSAHIPDSAMVMYTSHGREGAANAAAAAPFSAVTA